MRIEEFEPSDAEADFLTLGDMLRNFEAFAAFDLVSLTLQKEGETDEV